MRFFKEEGNNHYKNQRYKEASYYYQKAIVYADYTFPETEEGVITMEELTQQANCNLGLSLVKMDEWETARNNLNEASKGRNLKIKSKALYWLAKYYIRASQHDKAGTVIT
jgi:tetratricopeptide (TPR) repeat protein